MSEMRHYKGDFKILDFGGGSFNEQFHKLLKKYNLSEYSFEIEDSEEYVNFFHDSSERFVWSVSEKCFIEIISQNCAEDDEIFIIQKKEDNTFNYEIKWYDGCDSFKGVISDLIENYKKLNKEI